MGCGAPRVRSRKARHSGGGGAPPGLTKKPCQELADDLRVCQTPAITSPEALSKRRNGEGLETVRGSLAEHLWRKRGLPVRQVAAAGAPRGARASSDANHKGLRFLARHPPQGGPP